MTPSTEQDSPKTGALGRGIESLIDGAAAAEQKSEGSRESVESDSGAATCPVVGDGTGSGSSKYPARFCVIEASAALREDPMIGALSNAAKLIGLAAAGTVAVAACTLVGVKAVLSMRPQGKR